MRPRNFFSLKSGHPPSDAYFKYAPIHTDSDVLVITLASFFLGIVAGFFLFVAVL